MAQTTSPVLNYDVKTGRILAQTNDGWVYGMLHAPVAVLVSSGSTCAIPDNTSLVYVDPATALSSLTITLPRNPFDGDTVEILFGGKIASGSSVVTALTISPNTGQKIYGANVTTANGGLVLKYRYRAITNQWYRVQ
ncbi:MAG: hypothetical protein IRZ03_18285 [Acidobacterium ailaaui]|nr:hypothetical protein [Pseudacidobacterium ailaaui]